MTSIFRVLLFTYYQHAISRNIRKKGEYSDANVNNNPSNV